MIKRKILKGGTRRNTIESYDDFMADADTPSSAATTVDEFDVEEPIIKRPAKVSKKSASKEKSLPLQFLDNFLTDFTVDELAAKRTVETIYGSSSSFSYTFRCLAETLFTNECDKPLILSFTKAMAAVADEYFLRNLVVGAISPKKFVTSDSASLDASTLKNYEFLLVGTIKKLKDVMSLDANIFGWHKIMSWVRCLLLDGLSRELRSLVSSFFDEKDTIVDTILCGLSRFKDVISKLSNCAEGSKPKSKGSRKNKNAFGIQDCLEVMDQILDLFAFLRHVQRVVATAVANRSESEGLPALLEAIELELGIPSDVGTMNGVFPDTNGPCAAVKTSSGMDVDGPNVNAEGHQEFSIDYKVECVKLLLSNDCCGCLSDADLLSECDFLRQKFDNIYQSFAEYRQRQKEHQAELIKKSKLKRDAITYVLSRLSESESPSAPAVIRHPYYVVGIPPSKCTEEMLRRCGRKLKTLLHPDTEHDPEWKPRAEQAFKEASVALEKCAAMGGALPNYGHMRMGVQPPYAAFIGLVAQSDVESNSPSAAVSASESAIEAPTLTLLPPFMVSCIESKSGSISVSVDPSLFSMNGFKKLGNNKHLVVYMYRPTHGEEPAALRIHQSYIYGMKRVQLPETTNGKHVSVKIDAVQPIAFGSAWRYFVGVQVVGDLGASLVSWRSVYVELATKGRTASHVSKLLSTFEGAPFVNQGLLQGHLGRCRDGAKADAEAFLLDCAKSAQRWADIQ